MQSIAKYLLVSMFILMLVLVIMQVLYRYVLHIPIPWAEELARYLFTWLIFLGASLTSANDEHLSIDVFQDMLPDKVKLYVQIVLDVIILVFLALLLAMSIDLVSEVKSTKTPVLQISMALPYGSILFGSIFMFIHTVNNIILKVMKVVKREVVDS